MNGLPSFDNESAPEQHDEDVAGMLRMTFDAADDSAAEAKVVNLDAFRGGPAKAVSRDAFPEPTSVELLGRARQRIEHIHDVVNKALFRTLVPVGDTLVQAKVAYERETGTGHGHRNPDGIPSFADVAAEALDRSPSFVERLLKLAQLDAQTRELVDGIPKLAANQNALLALVREPLPAQRHLAVEAFRSGGRAAMNKVLDASLVDVEPDDRDDHEQETTLGFFTGYHEAKLARAAAEDRYRELRRHEESPATKRRRTNAKAVFDSLRSGETTLNPDTLERIGISRPASRQAVKDLRHSNLIQSCGRGQLGDTFEVLDDVVFDNQFATASSNSAAPTTKLAARTRTQRARTTGADIGGCLARIRDEIEKASGLLDQLDTRALGHDEVADSDRKFLLALSDVCRASRDHESEVPVESHSTVDEQMASMGFQPV